MNVSFFSMKGETFFVFVPQHRPSSFSLSFLIPSLTPSLSQLRPITCQLREIYLTILDFTPDIYLTST